MRKVTLLLHILQYKTTRYDTVDLIQKLTVSPRYHNNDMNIGTVNKYCTKDTWGRGHVYTTFA